MPRYGACRPVNVRAVMMAYIKSKRFAWSWLIVATCFYAGLAGANTVRYPRLAGDSVRAAGFFDQGDLLREALRRSSPSTVLQAHEYTDAMSLSRVYTDVVEGKNVDVIWRTTTVARETDLLPVRIPIDKGLFGWRVAVIRDEDHDQFAKIKTREQLASKRGGVGFDWSDRTIMEANQLPLETAPRGSLLFGMLNAKRFDYIPRSLAEIEGEAARYTELNLVPAPGFVIHYPSAMYFFVNRKKPELAEKIRLGLEAMIADGSFERDFRQRYAAVLHELQLKDRIVIELSNPTLPDATPLKRSALWFKPVTAGRAKR